MIDMFRNLRTLLVISATTLALITSIASHAVKPVYSGGKERAAIRGYDPVAYFTENAPVKGSAEFSHEYKGAKWLFSSAKNRDLFINNPDKYSPQYGGYCAYAVARNSTASIKPQYFTIHEGKLYLNYSKPVFKKWMKDKDGYIADAEKKWPELLKK